MYLIISLYPVLAGIDPIKRKFVIRTRNLKTDIVAFFHLADNRNLAGP